MIWWKSNSNDKDTEIIKDNKNKDNKNLKRKENPNDRKSKINIKYSRKTKDNPNQNKSYKAKDIKNRTKDLTFQKDKDINNNEEDEINNKKEKEYKNNDHKTNNLMKINSTDDKIKDNKSQEIYSKNYFINYHYKNSLYGNKIKEEYNIKIKSRAKSTHDYLFKFNKEKKNKNEIGKYNIIDNRNSFQKIYNDINNIDENNLYGFENTGNNCYLNSSLQLLTRIYELKKNIINFKEENICKSTATKGYLFFEFKNIINDIINNKKKLYPNRLKKVMISIDQRYSNNNQEDANEFISNFLDGLLEETADKYNPIQKNIYNFKNYEEEKAYEKLYNKFYKKIGNSFLLDLFYGILKTEKYCKCGNILSIRYNPYNMIELPIYDLAQNNSYSLSLEEIIMEYINPYKNPNIKCEKCGNNIYTKTEIIKLPQYLILYFGRTVGNKYLNIKIKYKEYMNFGNYLDKIKNKSYQLSCVIEHSGGAHYGHYTALCPINENDYNNQSTWYKISDSYWYKNKYDYDGDDAIILLYKSI